MISLCIGIRINSFVLFGIIGFASFILWIRKKEKRYGVIIFTILIGCLLGVFVPKLLYPNSYNASTLGMIWEMTGIVHDTNDPFLKQELGKYGNIEEAVNRYGEPFLNSIVWDYDPPFSAYDIAGKYAKNITVLYIRTAFKNPKEFIYNKWQFISRSLGINQPLISASRGIHSVDNITMSYGSVKTDLQETTRNNFIEFTDQMKGISLRPIVLIILCLTLILLAYKIHAIKDFQKYLFLLGIAVAYYTSFLINTQAYEFRYYAPSFYLMFVILVCIIIKIIAKLIEKWIIRKQSNKETCRCRKSRAIMK